MSPITEPVRDRPVTRSTATPTRTTIRSAEATPQRSLRSRIQFAQEPVATSPTPTRSLRSDCTFSPRSQIVHIDLHVNPLTPRNSGSRCRPLPRQLRRTRSRTTSQTLSVTTPDRTYSCSRPIYHDSLSRLVTPSRLSPDVKFVPLFTASPQDSTGCNIKLQEPTCRSYQIDHHQYPDPCIIGETTIWSGSFPIRVDSDYPRAVTPQDILRYTGLSESPLFYQAYEPMPITPRSDRIEATRSPNNTSTSNSYTTSDPYTGTFSDTTSPTELASPIEIDPELEVYFSFSPLVKESFGSTPVIAYFQAARESETRELGLDDSRLEDFEEGYRVASPLDRIEADFDTRMEDVWSETDSPQAHVRQGTTEDTVPMESRMTDPTSSGSISVAQIMKSPETQQVPLEQSVIIGLVDYPSPTPSPMFVDIRTDSLVEEELRSISPDRHEVIVQPGSSLIGMQTPFPAEASELVDKHEENGINPAVSAGTLRDQDSKVKDREILATSANPKRAVTENVEPTESHPGDTPNVTDSIPGPFQLSLSTEIVDRTHDMSPPETTQSHAMTSDEELQAMLLKIPDKRYPSRRGPRATSSAPPVDRKPGASFCSDSTDRSIAVEVPRPLAAAKRKPKPKPKPLQLKGRSQSSLNVTPVGTSNPDVVAIVRIEKEQGQQDVSDAESELTPLPEGES